MEATYVVAAIHITAATCVAADLLRSSGAPYTQDHIILFFRDLVYIFLPWVPKKQCIVLSQSTKMSVFYFKKLSELQVL